MHEERSKGAIVFIEEWDETRLMPLQVENLIAGWIGWYFVESADTSCKVTEWKNHRKNDLSMVFLEPVSLLPN